VTFHKLVRSSGYKAEFVNGSQVGIRDTITSLPGIDGVERYKSFYRDRLIEIRGFVIGSSEADLYDKINALESAFDIHNLEEDYTDGFAPLEFTDPGQSDARYYCKPIKNTLVIQERRTGFARGFTVLLEAKDPRKYVSTETTYTAQPATAGGTSAFPLTFPVVFSGDTFTGTVTITNTGNAGVYPSEIKIYGPCSGPMLTHQNGKKIVLTSDVVVSVDEYVLINPNYGTVYKYDAQGNGTNIIQYLSSGSEFFGLEAGENVITYTAQSMGAGSKAEIKIRFTT
jgi:hypothetical protein